ncbi:MAG: hypothetical protein BWZ03_00711 [bacterium ADurb.BinA186]|nr:MAG: hypothetical protein BWZ03_00711 [bacterium ADurb.BinA186]
MQAMIQKIIAQISAGLTGFQSALASFALKYLWNYGKKKIEDIKEKRIADEKLKDYKEKIGKEPADQERRDLDRDILS